MVTNKTVNVVAIGLVATIMLCIGAISVLAAFDVAVPEILAFTASTAVGSLASLLAFARTNASQDPKAVEAPVTQVI